MTVQDTRQQAEEEGKRLELEGCAAEHKAGEMTVSKEQEAITKGLWIPTMLEVGDTVGIIEPNLYTGVGVVKVENRGQIVRFCPEHAAAIVKYGDSQYGEVMIFLRDLLFYDRA